MIKLRVYNKSSRFLLFVIPNSNHQFLRTSPSQAHPNISEDYMTDQNISPDVISGDASAIEVEPLSVTDKFVGILTEPSATYDNLKQAGSRTSDWLVPVLVMTIVIAVGTYIKMSNPVMIEQTKEKIAQQFQERVSKGEMTQQQADQAMEAMDTFSGIQAIISTVAVLIFVPLVIFFVAFIYWLIFKFGFKGTATYSLLLAAYGLTAYFGAIDQLLTLLISLATGNMFASISPALLINADPTSTTFKLLTALNPISIWSMYVLSIGISKVSELSKEKALGVVFGLWLLWTLGTAFVKLPFAGM